VGPFDPDQPALTAIFSPYVVRVTGRYIDVAARFELMLLAIDTQRHRAFQEVEDVLEVVIAGVGRSATRCHLEEHLGEARTQLRRSLDAHCRVLETRQTT